jgi:hypothetical protein
MFRKTLKGLFEDTKDLVRGPVHSLLNEKLGKTRVRQMTYNDALEYAAERRSEHRNITATILRRKQLPEGWEILQTFVGGDNKLVTKNNGLLGRMILAQRLDAELDNVFDEEGNAYLELA